MRATPEVVVTLTEELWANSAARPPGWISPWSGSSPAWSCDTLEAG